MRPEDIKIGDELSMMGRVTIVVEDIDNKNEVLYTSIGPVPFCNVYMLRKIK